MHLLQYRSSGTSDGVIPTQAGILEVLKISLSWVVIRTYLKIVTFVSARHVPFEERSLHKVNEHRRTDRNAPAMNNLADKTHFEIGSSQYHPESGWRDA